jgi:outer membrane protein assembly factor BamE (lipoprotein component of BamABCDE complex)
MKKSMNILLLLIACLLLISNGCRSKQSMNNSNTKPNSLIVKSDTKEISKETSSQTEKDIAEASIKSLPPSNDKVKPSTEKSSNPIPTVVAQPPVKYEPSDKPNSKPICIGTTKDELLSIMGGYSGGSLTNFDPIYVFMRDRATILLTNDNGTIKVIGWNNAGNVFNVFAGEKTPSAPPITLGSSKENVAQVIGTPYYYGIPYNQDANTLKYTLAAIKHTQWRFSQGSFITFDGSGKVIGWYNAGDLKISYGVKDNSALPVKLGSSLEDVLRAFGTPPILVPYDNSNVSEAVDYNICGFTFDQKGKVNGWNNKGVEKISMGNKNPSAPSFKIGSSREDVINAIGTPDKVELNFTWFYGSSEVKFDSSWIVISYCNTGNLKVY